MNQILIRRDGVPFEFKGVSYPAAVLAFSSYQEHSVNRPPIVRIGARVFATLEDMEANFDDPLRIFEVTLTASRMETVERGVNNAILAQKVSDVVNVYALHSPQGMAILEWNAEARGGKRFTHAGLAALLAMPSITGDRTLGDEWAIPPAPEL